ncbi:molybdopterin converting factor subunit 1 [Litchfieldia salsa]|uniref:Molybdopterin synthase sulfur carrier subunit n=1 Tax=Litchfieldia salsa TaxID=930152 RepID=A0A1H0S838_9BACI|nr:molybdopterin converting factor subunit 1 [Litchfieldia salsa]SDP37827.1 molybdopterin synthase sulfur carrier subunit [Litchfieldia salsa]
MITVLLFAHLQEVVGKEKIILDHAPTTVRELKHQLQTRFGFEKLDQMMFAINEEYAVDEDLIKEHDTIAIIPPVSGG